MASHSNKKLVQHIENSAELLDKMHVTTQKLQTRLMDDFKTSFGLELPSLFLTRVRQTDITMCYSTDARVDEYIDGARTLLKAAFKGADKLEIVDSALDFVSVLARKIIGSAGIQIGVHSTGGYAGDYLTAAISVVEQAKAADFLTETNFFVAAFALVVWKPAPMTAMVGAARAMAAGTGPEVLEVLESPAERAYKFSPL